MVDMALTDNQYPRDLNYGDVEVGAAFLLADCLHWDPPVIAGQLTLEENLRISGCISGCMAAAPEVPDLHLRWSLANNIPANIF